MFQKFITYRGWVRFYINASEIKDMHSRVDLWEVGWGGQASVRAGKLTVKERTFVSRNNILYKAKEKRIVLWSHLQLKMGRVGGELRNFIIA